MSSGIGLLFGIRVSSARLDSLLASLSDLLARRRGAKIAGFALEHFECCGEPWKIRGKRQ